MPATDTRYIVVAPNGWYLRGTSWTGEIEHADRFGSWDNALTAMGQVKKFTKPTIYSKLRIDPEP